jgi:predicted AlkP superfamily phosphohydrolase/phosphomutase
MRRTVLIGLDGATFTVLDPLMRDGTMPFLAGLADDGVRAELLSTPNPLTPPAWTTLMTGRTPGNHGIFDFVRITPTAGAPQFAIATSRDVRCETVWSMASRQGRTVTALNFPLMFPPRPVAGYVIPGFLPWRHLRRYVHPASLYDALQTLPGFDASELLLDMDLERESLQVLPREQYERWVRLHLRREAQWAEIAVHLLTTDPSDLVAVLFDGVDKLQHLCWRFLDTSLFPARPTPWEQSIRDLCLGYFRQLDAHIARIVALAGDDATIVVASDHGFGGTGEIFYVNSFLERRGDLFWAEGVEPDARGKQMTEGHRSPVVLFDWARTRAFALTAGSNGIFIRRAQEAGGPGVPPGQYAAYRDALVRDLRALTDDEGRPIIADVLPRETAFAGTQMERAPDLTLVLRDRGFVSVLRSERVLRPRPEVVGTHRPEGVFLARGPGLRAGVRLEPLRIEDITPLLLYSLDLPIPEDLDGRLAEEAVAPELLRLRPGLHGAPTETPKSFFAARASEVDHGAEAAVIERLQALGYLE